MNVLKILVYEFFFLIIGKKQLIFFTTFYISHESGIKTLLKWSINEYHESTC